MNHSPEQPPGHGLQRHSWITRQRRCLGWWILLVDRTAEARQCGIRDDFSLCAGYDRLDGRKLVGRDEDGQVSVRGSERDEVDLAIADGRQFAA
jgi:hypothetical protein